MADNTGYSLIPDVTDPALPADQLSLLDQLADPASPVTQAQEPPPLGRTYVFDFVNQTLVPTIAGGPLMAYGLDALKQWIGKTLITDRAAAPVHMANDYGLDGANEFIDGTPFDAARAAELEALISDALTQHPRISAITDFEVDYDDGLESGNTPDDAMFVSFVVVPEGNDLDPLQVTRYPLTTPGPSVQGG
jgi:hypothetical protein